MEKKLDPVRVMPDEVWEQVLNRLDPGTLSVARTVSKGWSERAARSAVKREDVAVHASVAQLQAIHGAPLAFLVRFWHLAVVRTTHLFDYVRAYHEVARARVVAALLASAVLLVVTVPLALKTLASSWFGMAAQAAELALLLLPGFVGLPPRLAGAVCLMVSLVLLRHDARSLAAAPLLPPLPLVGPLVLAVMVWSLFAQRLALALEVPMPLFFRVTMLPLRSLRFVGWLMAAVRGAPLWLYAACAVVAVAVTARGRALLPSGVETVQFLVVGAVASAAVQGATWHLDGVALLQTALLVALLAWHLSTLPVPWFDRSVLAHSRRFRWLATVTIAAYICLFAWTSLKF